MTPRRSFLTSIATVLATATLDPEKLLWIPGQRHISIPAMVKPNFASRDQYACPYCLDSGQGCAQALKMEIEWQVKDLYWSLPSGTTTRITYYND